MQQIQIIGNLGDDARVVEFNGKKFVTFRVACSEKVTVDGKVTEVTQWYSCSYNRHDGAVVQYLRRGTTVFVQGKPSYAMYDSATYKCKMIDVRILVDKVQLGGIKRDAQGAPTPEAPEYMKPTEELAF